MSVPRYIPQEIWQDEKLARLSFEQRYCFLQLVTYANDDGSIPASLESKFSQTDLDSFYAAGLVSNGTIVDWWQYIISNEKDLVRVEVYSRDGYQCVYCGGPPEHIDHIHPRVKGGKNKVSNYVTACLRCNISKHSNDWFEWYQAQPFYDTSRAEYIASII